MATDGHEGELQPMRDNSKRPGFILFGDLHKIGPYLTHLYARDLAVLLVVGQGGSSLARRAIEMLGAPDHPFAGLADVSFREGGDLTGIVDQAVRWAGTYEIVGVLPAAEAYVEPGAVVCDLLGLPGVGLRASRVCRNKFLQRRYLREWSPRSTLVTRAADWTATRLAGELGGRFPLVVKPPTLESSIGVRLVQDAAALADCLAGLEPSDELLLEERVEGREYSVDSIVVGGEVIATMITEKGTNEESSEFFVELSHTTPPTNLSDNESRRIVQANTAVIERLRLETGGTCAEYRLAEDGRVVLMEIAARPPGDGCLWLHGLATGDPVEPALIDAALGRPTTYSETPRRRARQVYFDQSAGVLSDARLDWPSGADPRWLVETTGVWPPMPPVEQHSPPTLHEILVLKRRGERLPPLVDSSMRAVTALFDAPLGADIDAMEARVRKAVNVRIEADGLAGTDPGNPADLVAGTSDQ
jgi:hypothetical protein